MAEQLIAEKSAVVGGRNAKGRRTRSKIREGKIYRSDDPLVQGREHFFRPVEDTTQAPGEKRSIRKPRKQAEAATGQSPAKAAEAKPAKAADVGQVDDKAGE